MGGDSSSSLRHHCEMLATFINAVSPSLRRAVLLAWTAFATALFLMPLPASWQALETSSPLPLDKIAHLGLVGGAALLARTCRWPELPTAVTWMLYGAAIELLQAAGGYRVGDWADFVWDVAGVVCALVFFRLLSGRRGIV
jgi:hypothetical protein